MMMMDAVMLLVHSRTIMPEEVTSQDLFNRGAYLFIGYACIIFPIQSSLSFQTPMLFIFGHKNYMVFMTKYLEILMNRLENQSTFLRSVRKTRKKDTNTCE